MRIGRRWPSVGMGTIMIALLSAQPSLASTNLSIGTARADAGEAVLRIVAQASRNLSDFSHVQEVDSTARAVDWSFVFSPTIDLLSGERGALNGIVLKLTGNVYPHLAVEDRNIKRDQNFLVLPISAGIEADGRFETINGLAEVGITPRWRTGILSYRDIHLTLFGQLGYKFRTSDADSTGPMEDESKEAEEDMLGRLKADLSGSLDLPALPGLSEPEERLACRGRAIGWWDFVNQATYFRVEAGLRLPVASGRMIDLLYERGAGAPNFTTGEQFSANLTISF